MKVAPKHSHPVRVVSDTKAKTAGHPLLGRVIAPEPGKHKLVLGRLIGDGKGSEGHVLGRVVIPGQTKHHPGTHFLGRIVPHNEVPKGTPVLGRIVDPENRHAPAVLLGRLVQPDGKPAPAGGHLLGLIAQPGKKGGAWAPGGSGRPLMGRIISPEE